MGSIGLVWNKNFRIGSDKKMEPEIDCYLDAEIIENTKPSRTWSTTERLFFYLGLFSYEKGKKKNEIEWKSLMYGFLAPVGRNGFFTPKTKKMANPCWKPNKKKWKRKKKNDSIPSLCPTIQMISTLAHKYKDPIHYNRTL